MKKAFTLVELLVVISIIALLFSIAAVSYSRFVKQGRNARRKSDIEQVRAAIELYRNFNGVYPTPGTPGMAFGTGSIADATSTYMSRIPQDPVSTGSTAKTYFYTSPGPSYMDYTLCAFIEGGDTSVTTELCGAAECNYCMGPYGQK